MSERTTDNPENNGPLATIATLGLAALTFFGLTHVFSDATIEAARHPVKFERKVEKELERLEHFRLPHADTGATGPTYTGRDPRQITVNTRISQQDAERLFGVVLQEGAQDNGPSTPAQIAGAQKVAYIIGRNSFGWDATQDECLKEIWDRESGWRARAYNPASATGIPQDLLSVNGPDTFAHFPDFIANPVEQIQWGEDYIRGRYGDPCTANADWWKQTASDGSHWY